MNVIVSNKYSAMLSNLNIDLIRSINGEFDVDNLIAQFNNFFFNKMVLDITAIKNYQDITQIQRLSFGMDMGKIILLLDDSDIVNSPQYLSELVSMGIYNFTRNIDAVAYLIDNPNSYKDVAQFHMIGMNAGNYSANINTNQGNGAFFDNRLNGNEKSFDGSGAPSIKGTRIIGFKNLTDHAGATSLVYMLKKQLSQFYNVMGIELDKNDFLYFNDPDLKSISTDELSSFINNPSSLYDIILIDFNESPEEANCTEMIYLIEPSTLKLNKMVRKDRNILDKIKSKKVILNQSLLDSNDVKEFENEARCRVFHNIPPLDEKKERHRVIDEFLNKLGFDKNKPAADTSRTTKLFGIVKE
ncbi:MAG: hypothetical protein IJ475_00440 [Bacilli bacterium]|nr:hypothetical protein [Bacilli bacterium]